MADTLARVCGPVALAAAAATVYTSTGVTTTIRNIHVTNESGASAAFTLSIGTDGAGKRMFFQVPIGNGTAGFDWSGTLVLAPGELIQAYASAATALTLVMSGVTS